MMCYKGIYFVFTRNFKGVTDQKQLKPVKLV